MFFPYSLSTVFDGKLLLHVLSRVLQIKDNKHNTRNLTHTYLFFFLPWYHLFREAQKPSLFSEQIKFSDKFPNITIARGNVL